GHVGLAVPARLEAVEAAGVLVAARVVAGRRARALRELGLLTVRRGGLLVPSVGVTGHRALRHLLRLHPGLADRGGQALRPPGPPRAPRPPPPRPAPPRVCPRSPMPAAPAPVVPPPRPAMPPPELMPPRMSPVLRPPRIESRIGSAAGGRPPRSSSSASCRST